MFNKLRVFRDKRGFAIELAVVVIVIMSGVMILLTTLLMIQTINSKVSNEVIDCESAIGKYGEDFYVVAKNVILPPDGEKSVVTLDEEITTLDDYKVYLEKTFYAERICVDSSSGVDVVVHSPSYEVIDDPYYQYQPIDSSSYYYSYRIIEENNTVRLVLTIHFPTEEKRVYGILEQDFVENQVPDGLYYINTFVYDSRTVLDVIVARETRTLIETSTVEEVAVIKKWFYDSPIELGTNVAFDYLPYSLVEE